MNDHTLDSLVARDGDQPAGPYASVVHLEAGQVPSDGQVAEGTRALCIFWSDGRPIGQRWFGAEDRSDAPPLGETHRPTPEAQLASVSLVICTRDRPDELTRCLAGLSRQSRPPDEIIVVDNASGDERTHQAAQAAGVRYVREERAGLDIARNTGLAAAGSEIVAYTDDDTELHPRWLECLVAAFDCEEVVAVTGLVLPARLDTEAQWLFEREWSFGRGFSRIDFGPDFYRTTKRWGCPAWEIGAGANMAFRRSIFDRVGRFDERLDVGAAGCSGDSEMWYRILAHGLTCRYEPTAVVFHHHRLAMAGFRSQIFHYLRGHVAALLVQFERTGDWGNIRRAFMVLPYHYARSAVGRLLRGTRPSNCVLAEQIRGALSGLSFYFRSRRAPDQAGRGAISR